jgi:hypothetical protein
MTQAEEKELWNKRINHLQLLIGAAKQRGDIECVIQLEQELIEANNAFNAIT